MNYPPLSGFNQASRGAGGALLCFRRESEMQGSVPFSSPGFNLKTSLGRRNPESCSWAHILEATC